MNYHDPKSTEPQSLTGKKVLVYLTAYFRSTHNYDVDLVNFLIKEGCDVAITGYKTDFFEEKCKNRYLHPVHMKFFDCLPDYYVFNALLSKNFGSIARSFFLLLGYFFRYLLFPFNLFKISQAFRKEKYDFCVIINGGYPADFLAVTFHFYWTFKAPLAHIFHNIAVPYRPYSILDFFIDRRLQKRSTFLTTSEFTSSAFVQKRHMPHSQVSICPLGLKLYTENHIATIANQKDAFKEKFQIPKDKFVATVIASFEPRKGHLFLLNTVKQYEKDFADFVFLIIGSKNVEQDVDVPKEISKLNLENRFLCVGRQPSELLEKFITASDCLLVTSTANECTPYVILEAMRVKTLVLAPDLSGIPEQLDHNLNYIFKTNHSLELRNQLLSLKNLSQEKKLESQDWLYKRFVKNFTLEKMEESLRYNFLSLVAKK